MRTIIIISLASLMVCSCEKERMIAGIPDDTGFQLAVDDSRADIESPGITIELLEIFQYPDFRFPGGSYSLDLDKDGIYDFNLNAYAFVRYCGPYSKGPDYYGMTEFMVSKWNIVSLSENAEMLTDTVIRQVYSDNRLNIVKPKTLKRGDTFCASQGCWSSRIDKSDFDVKAPYPFAEEYRMYYDPGGGLTVFMDIYQGNCGYYDPCIVCAKGNDNVSFNDWIKEKVKYVGLKIEKENYIVLGWIKVRLVEDYNQQFKYMVLEEIGSVDIFQINRLYDK